MGRSAQLKRTRGYLLLLAVGLVGVIFVLGLTVVNFMRAHQLLVRKAEQTARAREAARAGVNLAISELRRDRTWSAGFQNQELTPEGFASLSFAGNQSVRNDGSEAITEPNGRVVPPGAIHLVCQGQSQDSTAVQEALLSLNTVILDNDFSLDAHQFTQVAGVPLVLAGYYLLNAGPAAQTLAGDETWGDYEADFTALLPSGTGVGFMARVTGPPDNPNGYLIDYDLLRAPLAGGSFRISRMQDGTVTTLAEGGPGLLGGVAFLLSLEHKFQVIVKGSDITVKVDGTQILTYHDDTPFKNGRIGIRPLLGTVLLVDRVTVTTLFEVVSQWRR